MRRRRRNRRNRKITVKFVQCAITTFHLNESTRKTLRQCNDGKAITHRDERTSQMTFYPASDLKDKDDQRFNKNFASCMNC